MQLVFLCGGRGTRLGPRGGIPKCLVPVRGAPLLAHLIDALGRHGGGGAPPIFVHAADDPHVPAFVAARIPGARLVAQLAPDGVASALLRAAPHVVGPALVALGDLLLAGALDPPPRAPAVGIWPEGGPAVVRANFGVALDRAGEAVTAVAEKPADPAGWLCGIGVYVVTPPVLAQLADGPVDPATGERGITAALAHALARGTRFLALRFRGRYVNVNTAADLAAAEGA